MPWFLMLPPTAKAWYLQHMPAKTPPNRTAIHQVAIRLTDSQLELLQRACQRMSPTYPPTVPRFVLTEALAAAEKVMAGKKRE